MKKLLFSVFTFVIGSVASAQPDSTQGQTIAVKYYINDQPLVGDVIGFDMNDIAHMEIEKPRRDVVRIYTKEQARERVVTVGHYLRTQFGDYGEDDRTTVFVDDVAVDVPAESVLILKSVKSVSRTSTPEVGSVYRIETISPVDIFFKKFGIKPLEGH